MVDTVDEAHSNAPMTTKVTRWTLALTCVVLTNCAPTLNTNIDAMSADSAADQNIATDTAPGRDVPVPIDGADSSMADSGNDLDTAGAPDTGPTIDSPMGVDSPVDSGPTRGTRGAYESCTGNNDCADALSMCDLFYPGGRCLPRCTSSADCPLSGICLPPFAPGMPMFCAPRCARLANNCNPNEYCLNLGILAPGAYGCWPSCGASTASSCAPGYQCDYGGFCFQTPSQGLVDGSPCTQNAECRGGLCLSGNANGPADSSLWWAGWLGGYCTSSARNPDPSAFHAGQPWPNVNCPPGTVPGARESPPAPNAAAGDWAVCFAGCTTSAQCRAGYMCLLGAASGGGFTSNGGCVPVNCSPSVPCPTGSRCVASSNVPGLSRCM